MVSCLPLQKANDPDCALVGHWHHDVQVAEKLVLLRSSACFPTDASHTKFRGSPSEFQQADPRASGSVETIHVQSCSAFVESVIHVVGQVQTDEEQRAELFGRESGPRAGRNSGEVPRSAWPSMLGGPWTKVTSARLLQRGCREKQVRKIGNHESTLQPWDRVAAARGSRGPRIWTTLAPPCLLL